MIVWKLGIIKNSTNPTPRDFETRWFPRKCDAKAAEPVLRTEGYQTLMLEKVVIPLREPNGLVKWLNQHAKN
jgi:hypothetical protein